MNDPYAHWCKSDTPQDLKDALLGGDQERLRTWCKKNPNRLLLALECIYPQHTVYREIVQQVLSAHQRTEDAERAGRQQQDSMTERKQASDRADRNHRWMRISVLASV